MKINKCIKDSFVVIGKEGSTNDGNDFIQKLWEKANTGFIEIEHLAKRDKHGNILGIWGAMSDLSRTFSPWEEKFTKGLYLAGVECLEDAEAPTGWTKWIIPGYEYVYVENNDSIIFTQVIKYLKENNLPLVGAVHDYSCPLEGKGYLFFPIRKLK